jgi:hypothetical protein
MSSKSDESTIFLHFQKLVECLCERKIKSLQSDWGDEYRGLHKILVSQGIMHHVTCPHTHHQNGMVELKHCHLVETKLYLLAHNLVPHVHWDLLFKNLVTIPHHNQVFF